jgi:uncharacterized protein
MSESKVYFHEDDDEMREASAEARKTFRYFWRELSWEYRRIIPALGLTAVKAPFRDEESDDEENPVEQMWFSDVGFDGLTVSGELLNSPNWLKSVSQGDRVEVPFDKISDWMYSFDGKVYGAYTVNLLRSRMKTRERREHDEAWGLDFGDPDDIQVVMPPEPAKGFFKNLFGKKPEADPDAEHPMCVNMAPTLLQELRKNPKLLKEKDDNGLTMLHREALAGNLLVVKVLLDAGADPAVKTKDGRTARQMASAMGWKNIVQLLKQTG